MTRPLTFGTRARGDDRRRGERRGAARLQRLRDGRGARADPPGGAGAAPDRGAAGRVPGRHADRRRLRRHRRDGGGDHRRVRAGAAVRRRGQGGNGAGAGFHLPGHPRRAAGGGEGHPVHAAPGDPRLRPACPPGRLEGGGEPLRRRRSDRRAAGDPTGRGVVPCRDRRPVRQRLDRGAPRVDADGPRGAGDPGDRRGDRRRRPARRRADRRRDDPRALCHRAGDGADGGAADRFGRALPGRRRTSPPLRRTRANRGQGFRRYLDEFVLAEGLPA